MSPRLDFGPLVKFDLAEAFDWYEIQEAGVGDRFLDAFDACLLRIQENPESFPIAHAGLRRALLQKFPYAVF